MPSTVACIPFWHGERPKENTVQRVARRSMTVNNQQNGRIRRNGIERSFPERDPAPRGQA